MQFKCRRQSTHPTMPSTRPAHCWRCTQHNTISPLHAQHIRITCQAGPGHNLHACTRAPQPSQACPVPCNDMSDCISNCLLPTASSLQLLASTPPCLQLLTAAHSTFRPCAPAAAYFWQIPVCCSCCSQQPSVPLQLLLKAPFPCRCSQHPQQYYSTPSPSQHLLRPGSCQASP